MTCKLWRSLHLRRMSAAGCARKRVSHVILDLDGTLLDTEKILHDVNEYMFMKFNKRWDANTLLKLVGLQQLECAQILVKDYELPCTAEQFLDLCEPLYRERWSTIRPLPGATRLIQHLRAHKIPHALASNSSKANILDKLKYQTGWESSFSVIVGGDEVSRGKPAPDIYTKAADLLGVDPDGCLVIEDSVPGVLAAKAAGMQVIAVPSFKIKDPREKYKSADCILSSLLDFKPEDWGLPPFQDWVCNALPIDPWYVSGPVIKGYGRGSKMLGIPTANLSTSSFSSTLSDYVCGIYFGWACIPQRGVFKMVMSVGWNPYFNNSEKTIEPWLLHEFSEDFYGEELRLVVVGYIRPEANFPSLEALVERIHEDGRIAKEALDVSPFMNYKFDPFLTNSANGQ